MRVEAPLAVVHLDLCRSGWVCHAWPAVRGANVCGSPGRRRNREPGPVHRGLAPNGRLSRCPALLPPAHGDFPARPGCGHVPRSGRVHSWGTRQLMRLTNARMWLTRWERLFVGRALRPDRARASGCWRARPIWWIIRRARPTGSILPLARALRPVPGARKGPHRTDSEGRASLVGPGTSSRSTRSVALLSSRSGPPLVGDDSRRHSHAGRTWMLGAKDPRSA